MQRDGFGHAQDFHLSMPSLVPVQVREAGFIGLVFFVHPWHHSLADVPHQLDEGCRRFDLLGEFLERYEKGSLARRSPLP